MNRTYIGVLIVLVVLAGGWLLFGRNTPSDSGPIKIGASLPLTGEAASLGQQVKDGIDLAVKEINDAGGISGRPVEIVYEDDRCDKTGANAVSKLVTIDRVDALMGPVCSAAAGPGAPIAQQARVPTIIWASAPGLTLAGDYIFRTYPSDSMQGSYAADYVYKLGKRKAAIFYTENAWGKGLYDTFKMRFVELGGTIVAEESMTQDSADARTQVVKIKSSGADVVYIPLYPANAVAAVKQARTLGLTSLLIGGDALEAKEFYSVPEAEGVMISEARFTTATEDFKARLKAVTGNDAGFYSGLGYDALNVFATVMRTAGTDAQAVRDALKNVYYRNGVSLPEISFDQNRDLKFGRFEIHIVKNGKTEVYTQ